MPLYGPDLCLEWKTLEIIFPHSHGLTRSISNCSCNAPGLYGWKTSHVVGEVALKTLNIVGNDDDEVDVFDDADVFVLEDADVFGDVEVDVLADVDGDLSQRDNVMSSVKYFFIFSIVVFSTSIKNSS